MSKAAEIVSATEHTSEDGISLRAKLRRFLPWFVALMAVWTVLGVGFVVYSVFGTSAPLLSFGRHRDWHTASLPSLRGRILDRNGVALAWSERWHCLVYTRAETHDTIWRDMYLLQDQFGVPARDMFGKVDRARHRQILLVWGLRPNQILTLGDWVQEHPRFQIETRFVRRYSPLVDSRLRRQLGRTQQFGWQEVGVSGWEAHFDQQLRGRDGKYRVQLKADGSWALETWEELRHPQAGYDVYLPFAVSKNSAGSSRVPSIAHVDSR